MILTTALLATVGLTTAPTPAASAASHPWTILFYGACDSSCEQSILHDIHALRDGLADVDGIEVVLFLDRAPGFSDDAHALGEDFEDARLYRIAGGAAERLDGGEHFPEITRDSAYEANSGDGATLRKFLRFGKAVSPAERYALIVYAHGSGPAMCPDETSEDRLYVGEISGALGVEDSVDVLGLDVCSMGGIENAYEWRPTPDRFGARVLVASGGVSFPWSYPDLTERLRDPAAIGARDFGNAIVDALRTHRDRMVRQDPEFARMGAMEAWASYDLEAAEEAKVAVDALARKLAADPDAAAKLAEVRGSGERPVCLNYMHEVPGDWMHSPYFDLYEIARRAADHPGLDEATREAARAVMDAVDQVVMDSFTVGLPDFRDGQHGLYVVFPDGELTDGGRAAWEAFGWYHPFDPPANRGASHRGYGNYAWCRDGATPGNGEVENWFELLDRWYDRGESEGGSNAYRP